jgi:uncharacterized protein YeaC (DUF1315 family)
VVATIMKRCRNNCLNEHSCIYKDNKEFQAEDRKCFKDKTELFNEAKREAIKEVISFLEHEAIEAEHETSYSYAQNVYEMARRVQQKFLPEE